MTTLAHKLYKIKITELEMMSDRGFRLDPRGTPIDQLTGMSFDEFKERYTKPSENITENMSGVYAAPFDRVLFKYLPRNADKSSEKRSVSIDQAKDVEVQMVKENVHHAIVVSEVKVSSAGVKILEGKRRTYRVELFSYSDLAINKTRHVLVPKHEVATDDEADEYNNTIAREDMKRILDSDPISKYYGFSVGQIVKITRTLLPYPTIAKEDITYRIVSKKNIEDVSIEQNVPDDDMDMPYDRYAEHFKATDIDD